LVAQNAAPVIINEYPRFPGRLEAFDRDDITAVISSPLMWEGRVTGVIHVLDDAQDRLFDDADRELLVRFCAQAAVAIQNARLIQEVGEVEALRQSSEMKSDFIAHISHELRTPLNPIVNYSDLLYSQRYGELNSDQLRFVSHIRDQAKYLNQLVEDILDLAHV